METYKEMKARQLKEVNALPIAFAFDDNQLKEKLAEWDITEEEAIAGAITNIGNGGFIRTSDADLVINTFRRIGDERSAAIAADHSGDGFIYQMFLTELRNHEFSYTQDADYTLQLLNISAEDLANNAALQHGLNAAIETINKADE